jgi:hypothetical protein
MRRTRRSLPGKFGKGSSVTNSKYDQGVFRPHNPEKYIGKVDEIVYRSSLEFKYMMQLDANPNVEKWASEEFHIPYISPKDGKRHRYFIDFIVWMKSGDKYMVEVKPDSQCKPPTQTKRKKNKTMINESLTYQVNCAKWTAAIAFCKAKGFEFKIITEKDLGITYGKKK